VEFIDPLAGRPAALRRDQLLPVSQDLNMRITIRMSVTDDTKIKVIIDPITGDYFEGQAKGDIVYVQFPDGRMVLTGGLEVVTGEYLYTYQGLVKRKFEVLPGSTITWIGDPFTPKLDLNVRYKARTSPYPLVASQQGGGETESTGLTQRQTFYVTLKIGGTPEKTEISTEITYPTGEGNTNNADVSAAIQSVNRDPSQQNTQAFALILFNGFIAPGAGGSDFQLVDLQGNVNSLITQQLNNLANRYVKFVELDFGLDTYSQEAGSSVETQTDFRVSVKKRFLNDRLAISIDGKTSTESGTQQGSSQAYLDNITVEYALTSDGRFKIKVYNKQDFDDFIGSTGLKMGGAFVFSKDFNSIRLKRK